MNAVVTKTSNSSTNERVYRVYSAGHCDAAFRAMRDFQERRILCDVIVRVCDEEYAAHKVVLASASPYFKDVFSGEVPSEVKRIVEIDLPPRSFKLILEYIYSGKFEITPKNVLDLIVASGILKMDTLGKECSSALTELLSPPDLFLDIMEGQSLSKKTYVFATGGWGDGYNQMSDCEVLNIEINTWHAIASMLNKRSYHAVIGFKRCLYAFGGWNDRETLSSVEFYDPVKDAWTLTTPLPHERSHHAICSLNGSIFIGGGGNKNRHYLNTVEEFDPATAQYKTCTPMTTKRYGFKMAATGDCIYAIGGNDGGSALDSVERYDPREGKWSPAPSMSTQRNWHGVIVLNDYIYCTGGWNGKKSGERFNIRSNKWEPITDMLLGRGGHELVASDGCVYAIGGYNLNSVEKYDPDTNRWSKVPSMLQKRGYLGASVLDCIEIKNL